MRSEGLWESLQAWMSWKFLRYRTWFQASSGNSESANWPGYKAEQSDEIAAIKSWEIDNIDLTQQFSLSIFGFHMTSPTVKLRNYRFFWVSAFMWYYSALKPLYKYIFDSKGFFVLRHLACEPQTYFISVVASLGGWNKSRKNQMLSQSKRHWTLDLLGFAWRGI